MILASTQETCVSNSMNQTSTKEACSSKCEKLSETDLKVPSDGNMLARDFRIIEHQIILSNAANSH
jgi:hypothetical protein